MYRQESQIASFKYVTPLVQFSRFFCNIVSFYVYQLEAVNNRGQSRTKEYLPPRMITIFQHDSDFYGVNE